MFGSFVGEAGMFFTPKSNFIRFFTVMRFRKRIIRRGRCPLDPRLE